MATTDLIENAIKQNEQSLENLKQQIKQQKAALRLLKIREKPINKFFTVIGIKITEPIAKLNGKLRIKATNPAYKYQVKAEGLLAKIREEPTKEQQEEAALIGLQLLDFNDKKSKNILRQLETLMNME